MTFGKGVSSRLERLLADSEELRLHSSGFKKHSKDAYLNYARMFGLDLSELAQIERPKFGNSYTLLSDYARRLEERGHLASAIDAIDGSIRAHSAYLDTLDSQSTLQLADAYVLASQLRSRVAEYSKANEYANLAVDLHEQRSHESAELKASYAISLLNLSHHTVSDNVDRSKDLMLKSADVFKSLVSIGHNEFAADLGHVYKSLERVAESDAEKSKYAKLAYEMKSAYDEWFDAQAEVDDSHDSDLHPRANVSFYADQSGLIEVSASAVYDEENMEQVSAMHETLIKHCDNFIEKNSVSNFDPRVMEYIRDLRLTLGNSPVEVQPYLLGFEVMRLRQLIPLVSNQFPEPLIVDLQSIRKLSEFILYAHKSSQPSRDLIHLDVSTDDEYHLALRAAKQISDSKNLVSEDVLSLLKSQVTQVNESIDADEMTHERAKSSLVNFVKVLISSIVRVIR